MTLNAANFPPGTPLHHFFVWNAQAWFADRRYRLMRRPETLPASVATALMAARGNPDAAAHAAVFAAFEAMQPATARRRILVIRLSAFGDFVQALGPFAAIRRHHAADELVLLTTRPYAEFAKVLGLFDEIIVDKRPATLALRDWWELRRRLRRGRFDRVYDLQTSRRSGRYAALLRPGLPEWSGIAWGCSHPHANRNRDAQHTLDKQAEQLLMAGIYPTPLPSLPRLDRPLPAELAGRDIVLLVPGSSPLRPEKRWPAMRFGAVARQVSGWGYVPVIVGSGSETPLAVTIRETCPDAVDLTGQTDLTSLAALAQQAKLTVGNDTGVCHLAAAAGCPVVVLFSRASDPDRCAPRGRLVRVLRRPDLADLSEARVIEEIVAMLGSTAAPDDITCNDEPRRERV